MAQIGFVKAVGRKQNETVAWQERERAYLEDLCAERGIKIETLVVKRENLSLPEYKAAMRKVETLEEQAEQIGSRNQELEVQTEELFQEIQKLEKKRNRRDILKQHTLRASGLKRFVESRGLGEALAEYLKSLASKTMGQKLKEAKAEAAERNWKRADDIHRMPEKERCQRQEL